MLIKITCTTDKYQAGRILEVPDEEAQELIESQCAIEYTDEAPKQKKVKHGNRQNDTQ
jgi:hypothetical protein